MKRLIFTVCLFIMSIQLINAQAKQISGTVTGSDDGIAMPGVSVVIKGTTTGTSTNIDGKYSIDAKPTDYLVFSFVGMVTQEILVGEQTVINISLDTESIGMDEVVVVGYGKQIKSELTGAISKVDIEGLQKVPAPSFETSMQGKTSGVFIQQSTGKLGEGINIRVRGASSLSASNQPLYVVDGVVVTSQDQGSTGNQPTNPIADLNFDDIASIQILKDASAASIYGSRASNGVVIITTKSGGKNKKTVINVNYSVAIAKETNRLDVLNTQEYVELLGEGMENSGWALSPGMNGQESILDWGGFSSIDETADTDWQDEMFRTAVSSNYNISASGGNEKTRFYAGLSYSDQEGILIDNDFKRMSGRLNLDHQLSEKIDFGIKFNFVRSVLDRVSDDNAFSTPTQLIAQAPYFPAYDESGEPFGDTFYFNGLLASKYNSYETLVYRTFANAYVDYKILPELSFKSVFGLDNLNQREDQYWSRKTDDGAPAGKAYLRNVNVLNYSLDNYFTFTKEFNENHRLEAVLGMSIQKAESRIDRVGGKGFPSDDFQTIASAAENDDFFSSKTEYSYLSYFSRLNYKYLDRYLATLSYRVDGSSKFGDDNRYGGFYAGSLGWIISKEDFLLDNPMMSFLKLRASYGITGNSEIGNFPSRGLFGGTRYSGNSAIEPTQLANSKLQWEKTAQTDIGIDFGLFDNRINGEIDYYYKKTTDLLLDRLLPYTSGYSSIAENVGELENKGWEFTINSNNLIGDFTWSTSFNIAFNKNEIIKLIDPIQSGVNRVMVGEPIGVFYMKKYAGVDSDNGDALYYIEEGSDETTNNYNLAEDMVVGDPNPDFFGGLDNTFSYKGFDARIFFQFVYGNDIYNDAGRFMSANGDWVDNQTRDQLDRWQKPGDITDIPQARFGDSNGTRTSSRWISDGSYIRLKDLTLGYTLPKSLTQKINVNKVRIYFTGQNLWTHTDFKGWDPEVSAPGSNRTQLTTNIRQGIDYYSTPQAKTYMFGVNLSF
ncbi:SusC/RagA family TonB-linked outer membrane protein [Marinifilum sp. N1E240]|uniref:SusC/RagA family TonB-linked outer membrane protein n=1 Tax=Marinifilum sp. N1E240 TaxID=2608082 RepID=UPI00128B7B18|nr:TonB-dependent receptor [Marinifilum sp. N1E240]MPQ47326.1 SusC/RagA family TonB-linked outer membrane protein [Marinifilum sp. N1E240]